MTVYNFSAGPAVLPKKVLEQAQSSLVDYQGSGMSILELSHRSSLFLAVIEECEQLLRELMKIPENYRVLFMQGGASLQFSMLPLNVAQGKKALYVNTGSWAKKAIAAAKKVPNVKVEVVASSEDTQYTTVPTIDVAQLDAEAAYLHITTNETIGGVTYHQIPQTGSLPLVADMSSNFLSNDYRVEDFAMIYAGAQKNLGPSGLTVVIIRDDFLNKEDVFSAMLDYRVQAENQSMYNTPPTFAIYVAKLVLEWVKELGGVPEIVKRNQQKAALLYEAIEQSLLFSSPVAKENRSLTNIPFITGNAELDKAFIKQATAAGFENIKGHRSVGGMRASIYNAFPLEGVQALIAFMEAFEKEQGEN